MEVRLYLLLSVFTDGEDGNVLRLEKLLSPFFKFSSCLGKIE